MEFTIVTGMSGAGKSATLNFFEDMGFFCVDNMPPSLIEKFAELCFNQDNGIDKVALGIDIRGGKLFNDLMENLEAFSKMDYEYKIVFLDASDSTLLKRFKETRRQHPLAKNGRLIDGITREKEVLKMIKEKADYVIDTSHLLTRELKETLIDIFIEKEKFNSLVITVLSFGFKYGIPSDVDLVFDVRFLPNPFYIQDLKEKTGNEKEVQDYVMSFDSAKEFLTKLEDMIMFLIPNYIKEGRNSLVIGIGCTGGKHRSVTLANNLFKILKSKKEYGVIVKHNNIDFDKSKH